MKAPPAPFTPAPCGLRHPTFFHRSPTSWVSSPLLKCVGESSVWMNWRGQPPALSSIPISHCHHYCLQLLQRTLSNPVLPSLASRFSVPGHCRSSLFGVSEGRNASRAWGPPAGCLRRLTGASAHTPSPAPARLVTGHSRSRGNQQAGRIQHQDALHASRALLLCLTCHPASVLS